jgi:hypothetical protein
MIWDYKAKLRIYEALCKKLESDKDSQWLTKWAAKLEDKPFTNPKKWNKYLDGLGCARIIKDKKIGWYYEDNAPREDEDSGGWLSLNKPGFIHVSNPIWPGTFHDSRHVIRMPKETAEKIVVLGLP